MKRTFFKAILLLNLLIFTIGPVAALKAQVLAREGMLDLSSWDAKNDGPLDLNGEWAFYWQQLFEPGDFTTGELPERTGYINAPGYWDGYEIGDQKLTGIGYATFRLQVTNLDKNSVFMLDLPLMHSSYKLWVNGELLSTNGIVGTSRSSSQAQYLPKTVVIRGFNTELELVLQISNFHHSHGGIWDALTLGLEEDIVYDAQTRTAFDLFLLGAIFIMALYHFGLFALRRKEGSTLLFGMFCLIISFRISVHGSSILSVIYPNLTWDLLVKLDYFTLYFGLCFYGAFIHKLYPIEFTKKILHLIVLLSSGFVFLTVVTPATVFTGMLMYYQAIMGLACLYVSYAVVKAVIAQREGARVVIGGCLILILAFVNDVLYNHKIIHTGDMVGAGLFLMIFSQSSALSLKFSKAFDLVEDLSVHLDQKVKERTSAIKDLLDNTGQGFFSFSQDYRIQKYASRATFEFFEHSIEDQNALTLMFPDDTDNQKQIMNLVFEDSGNLGLVKDILPTEIKRANKTYQVDYHWIDSRENIDGRMMIVMTDITTQRKLELQLQKDEEMNQMIVKIAVDRHGFIGFINEINKCLSQVERILKNPLTENGAEELFRHFHTIKGGMASYSFSEVAQKAHEIENILDQFREEAEQLGDEIIGQVSRETEALKRLLKQTLETLSQIVPKELIKAAQHSYFRISESKINSLETVLHNEILSDETIRNAVTDLRKQPLRNVMKKFATDAQALAATLGKKVNVQLSGEETEIIHLSYKALFASLIHLIRNCVDHGLELPAERLALGKQEVGNLEITMEAAEKGFKILIADDGAGIDAEMIKAKALAKRLITEEQAQTMTQDELAKLIFQPGFTTNETITDLSGRGVGMDAVSDEVDKLNGKIELRSTKDQGTQFVIAIPNF